VSDTRSRCDIRIVLHLAGIGLYNLNRSDQKDSLSRSAPGEHLEQLEGEDDECDDEKEMDQPASDVETESEKPENNENEDDGPKHDESPPKANGSYVIYGIYTPALTKDSRGVASASKLAP
jgi:hypothetical protein